MKKVVFVLLSLMLMPPTAWGQVSGGYVTIPNSTSVGNKRPKKRPPVVTPSKANNTTSPKTDAATPESGSALKQLFPLWGFTLGETTWSQAESLGATVEKFKEEKNDRVASMNGVSFWDHDGEGRFTSIYWTCYHSDFPASWKAKGFSWDNSYDTWLNTFRELGYSIKVKSEPKTVRYKRRKTLSAKVEATSADETLRFILDFNYGDQGYKSSSPRSLYSITIYYE